MNYQNKNWFSRNWKWLVPTGCLSIIVLMAVLFVAFISVFGNMMKDNEVYKYALSKVQNHPEVIAVIGTPIEDGWFPLGSYSSSTDYSNSTEEVLIEADLEISITGPKGSGTIKINCSKEDGKWDFEVFEVEFDKSNLRINLIEDVDDFWN